jgi:S-adenosylmethionine synthetase
MDLELTQTLDPPLAEQPVEVVERKGLGHPDTVCDALAEQVSLGLCAFYRERFGTVLHHNVDKVLLVGGHASPVFGGGEVDTPIEIYLSGRAADDVKGVRVPVDEIARERCEGWLRSNLRHLDVARHVRFHTRIRPGARELVDLFLRNAAGSEWLANDTSCGAGFAPLTPLERSVLELERALRTGSAPGSHPERGEDVKVMAVRRDGHVSYTVSDALVARHVPDMDAYLAARTSIANDVARITGAQEVSVNAGDEPQRGAIFLTVTGTSAEAGDDGEAGRGNRFGGLITPYRPMTMESVAGKNPVSHVGKIYNVLAGRVAQAAVDAARGVRSVDCHLVSRIGAPVSRPQLVHLRCALEPGRRLAELERPLKDAVAAQLEKLPALQEELMTGRLSIA